MSSTEDMSRLNNDVRIYLCLYEVTTGDENVCNEMMESVRYTVPAQSILRVCCGKSKV